MKENYLLGPHGHMDLEATLQQQQHSGEKEQKTSSYTRSVSKVYMSRHWPKASRGFWVLELSELGL